MNLLSPVAPPTYASDSKDSGPRLVYSESAFIPRANSSGWFNELDRLENDEPRRAPRVSLNGVAASGGDGEEATWKQRDRIGIKLPAIVISSEDAAEKAGNIRLAQALQGTLSSWQFAHRQAEAWIKYATSDGETLVWQQDVTEIGDEVTSDQVRSLIEQASAKRGDLLYRYFPNSAIYAYWLSSQVAERHRLPRAYSSEIIGYGAYPITTGTTKLDPAGGASKTTGITTAADGSLNIVPNKTTEKTKPSNLGFGQIPGKTAVTHYVCELILQQASISLQILRSLTFKTEEQSDAAITVLTILALIGHSLAGENGFLRSGCSLVAVDEKWGWRRHGVRDPEHMPVATIAELTEALHVAVAAAEKTGLTFAEPINLTYSGPEIELIKNRIDIDLKTAGEE